MTTATSSPPTREQPAAAAESSRQSQPRKASRRGGILILVLFAGVTAGVLGLAGMFDSSPSSDINIDPIASTPSAAPTTVAAPRPADAQVVRDYLAKMNTWNECMKKHPGEVATKPCGDMPAQIDDPSLNAYLAEVLEWNKCASPLLKHGTLAQAEAACGPQPGPATDK